MKTLTLKHGDRITANLNGQIVTGTVTGHGEHKGRQVVDFKSPSDIFERFCYVGQIMNINGQTV